jgi:hypothetical protein
MGNASVIHQLIMSVATANTLHGRGSMLNGLTSSMRKNSASPPANFNNPIGFLAVVCICSMVLIHDKFQLKLTNSIF